jgi:predicted NBD/HSP70 family sugar kinase
VASGREHNCRRVVAVLQSHPGISRTDVARRTGLSRPTVSALLDQLDAAGLLEQSASGHDAVRAGRPPLRVSLAPGAAYAVGLDIGHDHIRVGVCDLAGRLLCDAYAAEDVDDEPQETLDLACELASAVLADAGVGWASVIGVGVGIAAPVEAGTGALLANGILPSWAGVQPAPVLAERLGVPVRVDNDANAGALGEHMLGAGRGFDHVAYVRLSAGVGLGLILNGRPYHGAGIAGELGHVTVVPPALDGAVCRCGNRGCLETVASPVAVAALLERSGHGSVTVDELLALVASGDRAARRAVGDAGASVGRAVAAVVNVLNPQLIVIGGELAGAGEFVLAPLRGALARHAVGPAVDAARVCVGELGERAEVVGAAALLLSDAPRALASRLVASG